MRLRNANACGVDADRAKWSNVAFISELSSMAGATLGVPHTIIERADTIKNYLYDVLVAVHWLEKEYWLQSWKYQRDLVVDDRSTDKSVVIVRQFELDSVRVVILRNQGVATARNRPLLLRKDDLSQWLVTDHLLAPDKTVAPLGRNC
jgi:hypothetical protein